MSMIRINLRFSVLALVPVALVLSTTRAERLSAGERPNVLLICLDDLNQAPRCYGNPQVHTPNLDALAERSIRFTRAYAQWPSCLPSRFSFLSGWSPVTTQVVDFSARSRTGPLAGAVYLPQHFKGQGYTTARLDKIFHIGADDPASWNISEEPFRDEQGQFKAIWTGIEAEKLGLTDRVIRQGRYATVRGETGFYQVLDDVEDEALFDGRNATRAVELLERFAGTGESYFLAVGFRRPHLPWIAPRRYFDRYPPGEIELPPEQPGLVPPRDDRVHREMISHYFAALTFADAQVGRVLSALRRLQLDDNTIVVLFGDHGYCLGERDNFFAKGNLWERSLRTSLMIGLPDGHQAGMVCNEPVELLDLYPTLIDLCGLPNPDVELEGQSLRPLLDDVRADWRGDAVSYQYNKALDGLDRTIRTMRYRFTERADGTPSELIDYESDPYEWKNRVNDPQTADVRSRLRRRLNRRPSL